MTIEMKLSFYIYQIIGVGIIWGGMTFFFDKIEGNAIYIYYAVTSWLLFLIVLAIKKFITDQKNKQQK